MIFSAELAVLQRGNQRHASRYSNLVACAEWVGYRERKRFSRAWRVEATELRIGELGGTVHVRLKGVDAVEMNTALGQNAREIMLTIVGGSDLRCELTGEHTWHREVGFCFTTGGIDINRAIIEHGAALACPRYSERYAAYEQASALAAQPRASYCVKR
jgi:endonuclease YncB( thermonuclease family)